MVRAPRLRPAFVALACAVLAPAVHAEPASAPSGPAAAEMGPAPRSMSLDEAIAFARSHHLRLAASRHRVASAAQDAEVPGAQWLPRVGVVGQVVASTVNNSTTTVLGNSAVDLPRIGATPIRSTYDLQPYPSTVAALGIRQQLYDFGRVEAERAAAELLKAVEQRRLETSALDVDFAVRQAYYAVLAAGAIADASRAAFARASSHRDLARANVQSGLRPPIELTRADADVARYEAGMMRARASVRMARVAFALAVGVPEAELGATSGGAVDPPLPSIDSMIPHAERAPQVLEGRARAQAQRAETRRLEAQTRPTLWATGSVSGRAGGADATSGPTPFAEGWLPVVPNYNAGVVITWPIVEPTWDRRADASRLRELAADAEADLALQTQRAAIRTAYEEAVLARDTLGAAERGAEAARANWDQAEHRFGVGIGTSTELADAQALRAEADIQLAVARFQSARARAALARVVAESERAREGR